MLSVIETVLDRFEDIIYEIMVQRKKAENDISSLADPVVIHLINVLKWHDPLNYKKHLRNINNWLMRIQDIRFKKGKRFKPSDYYEWMFGEWAPSAVHIRRVIRVKLDNYHSLQVMKRLSHDLSQDRFEGIRNYL